MAINKKSEQKPNEKLENDAENPNESLENNVEKDGKSLENNAEKDKKKSVFSKSTLFVSTLPFTATSQDLEEFFSEIGPVRSCFVIKNRETGQHSGCGYVQYAMQSDAEKALTELKKKRFQGKRSLKIVPAIKKSIVAERRKCNLVLTKRELQ
jgi:nucleolar protein 4